MLVKISKINLDNALPCFLYRAILRLFEMHLPLSKRSSSWFGTFAASVSLYTNTVKHVLSSQSTEWPKWLLNTNDCWRQVEIRINCDFKKKFSLSALDRCLLNTRWQLRLGILYVLFLCGIWVADFTKAEPQERVEDAGTDQWRQRTPLDSGIHARERQTGHEEEVAFLFTFWSHLIRKMYVILISFCCYIFKCDGFFINSDFKIFFMKSVWNWRMKSNGCQKAVRKIRTTI